MVALAGNVSVLGEEADKMCQIFPLNLNYKDTKQILN